METPDSSSCVIAIDPGRAKCGAALVRQNGSVLRLALLPRESAISGILAWITEADPAAVVVGNSTGSLALREELLAARPGLALRVEDEENSTLEAREVYWQHRPPAGWRRVIPVSLQTPPEPIDQYAAVILAWRYLGYRGPFVLATVEEADSQ